jgi:hypothetical protein
MSDLSPKTTSSAQSGMPNGMPNRASTMAALQTFFMQNRKYLLRRMAIGLVWSFLFFVMIVGVCLVVIAVRTNVAPAFAVSDEIVLGSKIARAVIALQESRVLGGIIAFSIALGVFGSLIQSLPNTAEQSIDQYYRLREYQSTAHIQFDRTCPNCNAVMSGHFCSECGQQKIVSSELTLGGFVLHAISEVFNIDARFFRTLRLLITKPGFLTSEYLRVRRASYATPTQLYVVITAVFFLASIRVDFDVDSLVQQVPTLQQNIAKRAAAEHVSPEIIKDRMNNTLENYIPFYTLFIIVFFALCLRLVYRAWYYIEHLVFALHFITAVLMVWIFSIILEAFIPALSQNLSILFVVLISVVYLVMALRRVHDSVWWRIVPTVVAFLMLFGAYLVVTIALAMFLS